MARPASLSVTIIPDTMEDATRVSAHSNYLFEHPIRSTSIRRYQSRSMSMDDRERSIIKWPKNIKRFHDTNNIRYFNTNYHLIPVISLDFPTSIRSISDFRLLLLSPSLLFSFFLFALQNHPLPPFISIIHGRSTFCDRSLSSVTLCPPSVAVGNSSRITDPPPSPPSPFPRLFGLQITFPKRQRHRQPELYVPPPCGKNSTF